MPKTSTFWFTCSWCVFLFGSQRWDTIFGISKFRSCNKMKWLFEIWVQNDIIYLGVEQQCNTLLRHSLDGSHSYYYYYCCYFIERHHSKSQRKSETGFHNRRYPMLMKLYEAEVRFAFSRILTIEFCLARPQGHHQKKRNMAKMYRLVVNQPVDILYCPQKKLQLLLSSASRVAAPSPSLAWAHRWP